LFSGPAKATLASRMIPGTDGAGILRPVALPPVPWQARPPASPWLHPETGPIGHDRLKHSDTSILMTDVRQHGFMSPWCGHQRPCPGKISSRATGFVRHSDIIDGLSAFPGYAWPIASRRLRLDRFSPGGETHSSRRTPHWAALASPGPSDDTGRLGPRAGSLPASPGQVWPGRSQI
jgi:hypothetical protein